MPPCDDVANQNDLFYACTDACKLTLCGTDKSKIKEVDCPTGTPHCVTNEGDKTGSCSSNPGTGTACTANVAQFKCTSFGVFPGKLYTKIKVLGLDEPYLSIFYRYIL